MRTEELQKEAELYKGEGKCYVHIEQADIEKMNMITEGDPAALLAALYCLTTEVAAVTNKTPIEIWKMFIRTYRKRGTPEHSEF